MSGIQSSIPPVQSALVVPQASTAFNSNHKEIVGAVMDAAKDYQQYLREQGQEILQRGQGKIPTLVNQYAEQRQARIWSCIKTSGCIAVALFAISVCSITSVYAD